MNFRKMMQGMGSSSIRKSFRLNKIKAGFLILVILFVVTGCSTQKAWVYTPSPLSMNEALSQNKAVVLPFDDLRQNENNNKFFIYMIPLVPFGWGDYTVPEGAVMHANSGLWVNYKPTEDFPKALAQELNNRRIFQEAYFDYKRGDGDIIVKGEILSTMYNGKVISYGLSVYGPLLWYICFPATFVENDLEVRLTCIDARSNNPLFTKAYKAPTYSATSIIYSLQNDFNYAAMLKGVYNQFIDDIKAQKVGVRKY